MQHCNKPTVTDVRVKIHNENRNITIELYSLAAYVRNMARKISKPLLMIENDWIKIMADKSFATRFDLKSLRLIKKSRSQQN